MRLDFGGSGRLGRWALMSRLVINTAAVQADIPGDTEGSAETVTGES